jgi:hypothetical protein
MVQMSTDVRRLESLAVDGDKMFGVAFRRKIRQKSKAILSYTTEAGVMDTNGRVSCRKRGGF